jgi:glycosyltransferase involved in cell wall biosynthesis
VFEIVKDQVNGLLCRIKDPNDLALKMIEFIKMPAGKRKKMGLAGRALVETEYNENYVIERYLEAVRVAVS